MGHRDDLLAAARRCLEERGYARTTARDLVAASGTNLASIGYHFGSKEALLTEAITAVTQEWVERIRSVTVATEADDGDPTRKLTAAWNALFGMFAEYRGLAVAFVEALAQAERQPEVRARLAEFYAQARTTVAEMVTDAVGELPEPRATALASFHLALCDGLLVQWMVDPDAAPSTSELADALATMQSAATSARGVGS